MAYTIALILTGTFFLGLLIFVCFIMPYYLLICQDLNTYFVTSFRIQPWHFFAFFLSIGICWLLAQKVDQMYTINGNGTKLFGRTPSDKGYISTKWVCVLFLPILPLASYEILDEQRYSMGVQYAMKRLDKLFWPQITQTIARSLAWVSGVIGVLFVLLNFNCFL